MGYTEDDSPGSMLLEASIAGTHNTGQWCTDDSNRPGRIGPKLADSDKLALIEYLKSANYDNYPKTKVPSEQALPCAGDKDWAKQPSAR
jgi:hypothetical protein